MSGAEQKADLHRYLRRAREALLWKLEGLDEYDIRRPLTPTGTNLLGLVKHLAVVEAGYFGLVFDRPMPEPVPWDPDDSDPDTLNADMWATAEEPREYILGWYRDACEHADATIEALDLETTGLVPWWPEGRNRPPLYRLLIHMVAETNRHGGHADIVRELIDGSAGLQKGNDNLPTDDAAWWQGHYERVEAAAREAANR